MPYRERDFKEMMEGGYFYQDHATKHVTEHATQI